MPFAECLKEAQRLGYAEADPSFDIEGMTPHRSLRSWRALRLAPRSTRARSMRKAYPRYTRRSLSQRMSLATASSFWVWL